MQSKVIARAALALSALIAAGCGGSKPEPGRDIDPGLPMAQDAPDKGQGSITFRYSNKTTDANLSIDLGSTDVYLEMSGKAAQEQAESMRDAQPSPAPGKRAAKYAPPSQEGSEENTASGSEQSKTPAGMRPDMAKAKAQAKTAPDRKPEPAEEEELPYEDVTAKVLSGIRRAQEFFYQKRYPEAMQAVRSSLDARSTAEGHALAGSIHFMQGQTGMARRQWMEALRINPDMPAVVNMLEKTRTPGGRGSPSPRPISRPAPPPAAVDAPYPEEYSGPVPSAGPVAPVQEAASAPALAPARAPQAVRTVPQGPTAPLVPSPPVASEPADEPLVEEPAPAEAVAEPAAPAATPAPADPAPAPAKPVSAAAKPPEVPVAPAAAASVKVPAEAPAKAVPAAAPKTLPVKDSTKPAAKPKAEAKPASAAQEAKK